MTTAWSAEEIEHLGAAHELEIAVPRADGTWRRGVPIWVVCVEDRAYVRTWYRRRSGWFGRAVDTGRARVRVPGLATDVVVEDVGAGPPELRAGVDEAYRTKYGRYGPGSVGPMVNDDAAATTLLLRPDRT